MATNEVSASQLQKGFSMKSVIVGMLAVALLALSGCGVGVDETLGADGTPVAETHQAVLTGAPGTNNYGPPQPGTGPDVNPVALPQDPIPLFEGKAVGGPQDPRNPR